MLGRGTSCRDKSPRRVVVTERCNQGKKESGVRVDPKGYRIDERFVELADMLNASWGRGGFTEARRAKSDGIDIRHHAMHPDARTP